MRPARSPIPAQFTKPGPHPEGIRFGIDTTESTEIPSRPGPGYVFSGGTSEAARAAPVAWTTAKLSCSGPGVTPAPDIGGATVNVVPGETILVTCQES